MLSGPLPLLLTMLSPLGYDLVVAEAQARADAAVMPLDFELLGERDLSDFGVWNYPSTPCCSCVVIQATLQYCLIVDRVCETANRCLFFLAIPRDEWNLPSADDGFGGRRGLMRLEVLVLALRNNCLIYDKPSKATAIAVIDYRCLILVGEWGVDARII